MLIPSLSDTVFKRKHKSKLQKSKAQPGLCSLCMCNATALTQHSGCISKIFSRQTLFCRTTLFRAPNKRLLNLLWRIKKKKEGRIIFVQSWLQNAKRKQKKGKETWWQWLGNSGCSKETVWFFIKRLFLLYTFPLSQRNGCGFPSWQGLGGLSSTTCSAIADRDHGAGK